MRAEEALAGALAPPGEAVILALDQAVLEAIPAAVYLCQTDGVIIRYNRRAAKLWGRSPRTGDSYERFCGAARLFRLDGSSLPHNRTPMQACLRTGQQQRNQEVVIERPDASRVVVLVNIEPVLDNSGRILGAINCFHDITERKRAEEQQAFLINELNHRVKNTLATVQAIALQTFHGAEIDQSIRERFEARLVALSDAHSVLTQDNWEGANIDQLIAEALHPHASPERLHLQGPPLRLLPKAAVAIAMAMHELATNAAKYGALSNATGQVAVMWAVSASDPAILTLEWRESGGPPVSEPKRRGFGSRLIERSLAHDLDGQARIDFHQEGVVCTIVNRLERVGCLKKC